MNKLVYCFWPRAIKEQWEKTGKNKSFEETLQQSVLNLSMSAIKAKKEKFEVEIITDLVQAEYFKTLNVGDVFSDLELINIGEHIWIEAKMIAIAKQREPFLYIDWNIHIQGAAISNIIKNSTSDLLVASQYSIVLDGNIDYESNKVQYGFLRAYSWIIDMSGVYIDEFVQNNEYAFDCRILGFNDLSLRDIYVDNFYKCLAKTRLSSWFVNSTLIIEEYLLYCLAKSHKSSVQEILEGQKTKMNQIQGDHEELLTFSNDYINDVFETTIRHSFSEYDFLIPKKQVFQNSIKISLCTVVMNRKEHLVDTLKNNLEVSRQFNGAVDLNVIDYNSQDGLEEFLFGQDWFLKGIDDGLIHYFKNYEAEHYHRTLPKNAVHFMAKGEYLFNVDADNYITESYLTYCMVALEKKSNLYFRSSLVSHEGAFGRIGIHRDDFKTLGGYNLNMENYGFEDTEITLRLRKLGREQHLVPSHLCLKVIDHENEMRIQNEKEVTHEDFDRFVMESDHKNRRLKIEINPNKNIKSILEIFRIDSKKQKTLIYDNTYPYISNEFIC